MDLEQEIERIGIALVLRSTEIPLNSVEGRKFIGEKLREMAAFTRKQTLHEMSLCCKITGSPCGTDTILAGTACLCEPCAEWRGLQKGEEQP